MNETKKIMPIILSIAASAGTIGLAFLVAKETPKVKEKLDANKEANNLEKAKIIGKGYWPAMLVGAATISSITASTIISKKAEASLIATSAVLSQGWNRYKYKIKELLGEKGEKKITDLISNDEFKQKSTDILEKKDSNKQLYWEEHLGFFECNPVNFMAAINDLNQRLHSPDPDVNGTFYWTTLAIFAKDADAKVFEKDKLEASKHIGWTSDYLLEVYGSQCVWVHPYYTRVLDKKTKELRYIKVDFWEEPIILQKDETSRFNYKTRKNFEHEAESDENFQPCIDEEIVTEKLDCSFEDDDLAHMIPTKATELDQIIYSDGSDPNNPDDTRWGVNDIPDEKTIPTI